jgi:hypothetical protein
LLEAPRKIDQVWIKVTPRKLREPQIEITQYGSHGNVCEAEPIAKAELVITREASDLAHATLDFTPLARLPLRTPLLRSTRTLPKN